LQFEIPKEGAIMFKHILFPTDGSKASLEAADVLARLVSEQGRVNVTIGVVVTPLAGESDYRDEWLEKHKVWLRREAQRAADNAVAVLRGTGANCITRILEGKPVSAVLASELGAGDYDLVVMSSRGLGQEHDRLRYLGSVTEHLIRRAAVPVLVVPVKDEEED
jgi:nucleotide-binding universal stress UspA family protein